MIIGVLSLLFTISVYVTAKWIYRHKSKLYLSPLIVTPLLISLCLLWWKIPYDSYNSGAKWLTAMLQPATIAFAIPLYKYYKTLKKHAVAIVVSVCCGSVFAIISSGLLARSFHLNTQLVESMIPRSVTTPIAMDVSSSLGGIPTMTAVFVILTGILGTIIGPLVIRLFRIKNDIARGVLLGTSAHGAGTSKAFELSSLAGTISSISMILAGVFTLFVAPWMTSVVKLH